LETAQQSDIPSPNTRPGRPFYSAPRYIPSPKPDQRDPAALYPFIQRDLDFTAANWGGTTCDLWEVTMMPLNEKPIQLFGVRVRAKKEKKTDV
jgi:hypothetical protein